MSSGQIFLVLGALILLSFNSINMNRAYVMSVRDSVEIQRELEAVQFGQAIVEVMYSHATTKHKALLSSNYGNCYDIDHECGAPLEPLTTILGTKLKATVEFKASAIAESLAVITVYEEIDGAYQKSGVEFKAALTFIDIDKD